MKPPNLVLRRNRSSQIRLTGGFNPAAGSILWNNDRMDHQKIPKTTSHFTQPSFDGVSISISWIEKSHVQVNVLLHGHSMSNQHRKIYIYIHTNSMYIYIHTLYLHIHYIHIYTLVIESTPHAMCRYVWGELLVALPWRSWLQNLLKFAEAFQGKEAILAWWAQWDVADIHGIFVGTSGH